jgi:hypothetical protein
MAGQTVQLYITLSADLQGEGRGSIWDSSSSQIYVAVPIRHGRTRFCAWRPERSD